MNRQGEFKYVFQLQHNDFTAYFLHEQMLHTGTLETSKAHNERIYSFYYPLRCNVFTGR